MNAIETKDLRRIYKIKKTKKEPARELLALDNISLEIKQGELFGLLGPNGAGKTTLIKILTTLLAPSSGSAKVMGKDVIKDNQAIRQQINMVSGGETSGYGLLTVKENLWMFSQFYGIPTKLANQRIMTLLKIVGLEDRANTKSSDLSTGLRQKMNIVRGFMTDPQVLFLDEPTLGLDVGASRDVRQFVRQWVDEDHTRTLLLTTHYMAEADELCDRVAIINHGRILACDTPANLKRHLMKNAIFDLEISHLESRLYEAMKCINGIKQATSKEGDGLVELEVVLDNDACLAALIAFFTENDISILNLSKRQASLEDVFVSLVGQSMKEVERGSGE